jgi:hypothetical protein
MGKYINMARVIRFKPTKRNEWAVYGVDHMAEMRRRVDGMISLWAKDLIAFQWVQVAVYDGLSMANEHIERDLFSLPDRFFLSRNQELYAAA